MNICYPIQKRLFFYGFLIFALAFVITCKTCSEKPPGKFKSLTGKFLFLNQDGFYEEIEECRKSVQ